MTTAMVLALAFSTAGGGELVLSDFETPGQWSGLVQSAEQVKQGKFSGKWQRMDKTPAVALANCPSDWSPYGALSLWMYNVRRLKGAAFMLIIRSDNPKTKGMDYWAFRFDLSTWQGWRKFVIPFAELGRGARQPVGWHKIDGLTLTAAGWGNTPNPQAVVYIDDVRLIPMSRMQGPRITDEEFFNALDLSWPGLERVAAAVRARDYKTAKKELLAYYRRREKPRFFFDWREGPRKLGKPPRAGSEGWDYYACKITVDWTGWKRFRLRKDDFSPSRKPIGWDWITYIRFNASGWGEKPDPSTVLYFDDFKLVGPGGEVSLGDFENGPGDWQNVDVTDELAHSGKWSAKWAHMDQTSWIGHNRPPVDWTKYQYLEFWAYSPKATGARITVVLNSDELKFPAADAVLAHRWLKLHGKPYDLGPDIKWDIFPFKPDDPARTREWTWCGLNRMSQWVTLMRAYWDSGDEKYARETVAQMMDWVKDCPVPLLTSGNQSMCWRTIECGIRMGQTWPEVFFRLLASPSFTPEACCTMVKSMVEHARHLMHWRTGGNWLTMECNGLGHVGIMFPEFKEAAAWRQTAINTMLKELNHQVYPDGAQFELTMGYHHVALHNFLGLYKFAVLNDVPMPAEYTKRLRKMFVYDVLLAEPDGATPAFNDSGRVPVARWLREAHELFPDDPLFQWATSQGKRGRGPQFTSYMFPYAGFMVFRSAWHNRDARYLCMEAGPFGYGHQHEDKLSFVMYGYGMEHITDPGNYRYDASQWRRYVLSTRAHNTIRIDGKDQARRGLRETYVTQKPLSDVKWLTSDKLDFGEGIYDSGYGPGRRINVIHRRQVVFVRPDYWVIVDTLTGDGEHSIQSLFHFNHDEAEVEGTAVRTIDPDTSNCIVAAAPIQRLQVKVVKGQTEPEVQGFIPAQRWRPSWKNPDAKPPAHGKREIPTAVFTLRTKLPAELAYVIMPYPEGQRPQVTCRLLPVEGRGTAVEVSLPGGRKQVVLIGGEGETVRCGQMATERQVALFDLTGAGPRKAAEL